jgi:hypothetical protein
VVDQDVHVTSHADVEVECWNDHETDDMGAQEEEEEFLQQLDDGDNAGDGLVQTGPATNMSTHPRILRSAMPTWLCDDYHDTCERLKLEMQKNVSGKPCCYDAGQFYDLPRLPLFNSLNQVQLEPSSFYRPTYFVWLPHLFARIPCPSCKLA